MSGDFREDLRLGSDPLVFFKGGQGGPGEGISRGHIMAAALSRALRDGETLFIGANPLVPLAAARLAQLTHAPNLAVVAGASGGVNPLLEPLAPSSGDYANLVAEAVLAFPEVLWLVMGGHADVFFAGGVQIDARGNCNLAMVGDPRRPRLRGPGSAGIPWAIKAKRIFLYTTSHTPRTFVPQVDFISLPGWPEVPSDGASQGPELVVTPLAVMDFAPDGKMRLASLHPGVTREEVQARTGFELHIPQGEIPVTATPSEHEMLLMRQFDLDGLLAVVAGDAR